MLETYQKAKQTRQLNQQVLSKLIDRINLDRPIMQKEKVDLILLEKLSTENKSSQSPDKEIKSSEIRHLLKNVQDKRKVENKRNTKAYF